MFAGLSGAIPARLLIVGGGMQRNMLGALAAELGIAEKVVFAGHVEAPQKILGWFDVFAITSDTEQMPLTVIEAMAAGLPVVGVDVGDVRINVAKENRPFIVSKDDEECLQGVLEGLLGDAETRLHLGKCNRRHANAYYSEGHMIDAYKTLIRDCLESRPPASEASPTNSDN